MLQSHPFSKQARNQGDNRVNPTLHEMFKNIWLLGTTTRYNNFVPGTYQGQGPVAK